MFINVGTCDDYEEGRTSLYAPDRNVAAAAREQ